MLLAAVQPGGLRRMQPHATPCGAPNRASPNRISGGANQHTHLCPASSYPNHATANPLR